MKNDDLDIPKARLKQKKNSQQVLTNKENK